MLHSRFQESSGQNAFAGDTAPSPGGDGCSLNRSPLPPGQRFRGLALQKLLEWGMAKRPSIKAQTAPSSFLRFPASQGSPDAKPKTWLNQRELGRVFGLNGSQMGQALTAAGWRTAEGSPSPECLEAGQAKSVVRTVYDRVSDGPSRPVIDHRWHAQKAVSGLEAITELKALGPQEVFARALADQIVTGMKPLMRAAARARQQGQSYGWKQELEKAVWLSDRLKLNLEKVSHDELPSFMGTLRTLLVARGIKSAPLEALLQVAGHLHGLRAHDLNVSLVQASEPARKPRPRF